MHEDVACMVVSSLWRERGEEQLKTCFPFSQAWVLMVEWNCAYDQKRLSVSKRMRSKGWKRFGSAYGTRELEASTSLTVLGKSDLGLCGDCWIKALMGLAMNLLQLPHRGDSGVHMEAFSLDGVPLDTAARFGEKSPDGERGMNCHVDAARGKRGMGEVGTVDGDENG